MVRQYPRFPDLKVLLDILAQQQEEPSVQSLMESQDPDDAQHAANWEAVVQYVKNIDASSLHGHASLLTSLA